MPLGLTAVVYPTPLFFLLSLALPPTLSFFLRFDENRLAHARTVKLPAHVASRISCAAPGTLPWPVNVSPLCCWISINKIWKTKVSRARPIT